jgi:hypothetical protein
LILCDEWTPAQVKAFRLMVNRSVAWADWDEELLALELRDLNESVACPHSPRSSLEQPAELTGTNIFVV